MIVFSPIFYFAPTPSPALTATEHGLKKIRKITFIKTPGKSSTLTGRISSLPSRLLRLFKLFSVFPVFTVLIILLAFLRITQYFVCLIDLLKFFIRLFIIWIQIGVILSGQFTISIFDLFVGRVFV